jgi:hypothetical protein
MVKWESGRDPLPDFTAGIMRTGNWETTSHDLMGVNPRGSWPISNNQYIHKLIWRLMTAQ